MAFPAASASDSRVLRLGPARTCARTSSNVCPTFVTSSCGSEFGSEAAACEPRRLIGYREPSPLLHDLASVLLQPGRSIDGVGSERRQR
jgi:hypothetical protein